MAPIPAPAPGPGPGPGPAPAHGPGPGPSAAAPPPAAGESAAARPAVLVVDDEPGVLEVLGYALRREGLDVTCCASAHQGLRTLAQQHFDLLVLDVLLPDGNGFEICRRLRGESRLPILFLTSRDEETDRVVGLEIGADDYVTKPFSPREVAARVKAILRRVAPAGAAPGQAPAGPPASVPDPAPSTGAAPLRAAHLPALPAAPPPTVHGPFIAHHDRFEALYRGTPLGLSRAEYGVLLLLLRAPGRVFTREHFLQAAWGDEAAVCERTVDAHIKALRRKIRSVDRSFDAIETVRGIGYRLRDVS